MSQIQEQLAPETQQTPPIDIGDIFADHMTEEAIGALLDDDKPEGGETPPVAQQPQPDPAQPPQPVQPPVEAPKAEEQAPEDDGVYTVPLFGRDVDLDGDQLVELAEAGAQLIQHRPQVEKAMTLLRAVEQDQQLQAILTAYANGQPLPGAQPQQAPQPGTPEEAVAQFKQQVMREMLPHLMKQVEERYKPFVENVSKFAIDYHQERAFSQFKADPDYEAVNQCMQTNVNQKLIEGQINHQEAAQIMQALRSDPQLYGQWFPKFKDALTKARQAQAAPQAQPAQVPGRAADGKFVQRAPKLEGQAAGAAETQGEIIGQRWKSGDRSGAFASALMNGL